MYVCMYVCIRKKRRKRKPDRSLALDSLGLQVTWKPGHSPFRGPPSSSSGWTLT